MPAVWKCALWMASSLCETIPIMKLSQPITSCAAAYSQRIGGRLRPLAHSRHIVVLQPHKYLRSKTFTLECVPKVSIQFSTVFVNSWRAAARPTSWQWAMCLHVLSHSWQLGHRGLRPPWCNRNFIVPAMPRTCLDTPIIGTATVDHGSCCG